MSGLLKEGANSIILIDVDDSESARFNPRHFETANRDVSLLADVLLQHHLVIHFVDVIASKQHDISAAMAFNDIDVLVYRVRRAEVPHRFGDPLAGRKDIEALVALWAKEIPTHLKMPNEAMGLILGRNSDTTNPRVQSVRKREVDNTRLSSEVDGWFGTLICQLQQPASSSASQDKGESIPSQRFVWDRSHHLLP
jgi:hypothetical protein